MCIYAAGFSYNGVLMVAESEFDKYFSYKSTFDTSEFKMAAFGLHCYVKQLIITCHIDDFAFHKAQKYMKIDHAVSKTLTGISKELVGEHHLD